MSTPEKVIKSPYSELEEKLDIVEKNIDKFKRGFEKRFDVLEFQMKIISAVLCACIFLTGLHISRLFLP